MKVYANLFNSTLKSYEQRNNVGNKNWHFLTGSKSEIYNLARKSYFAEEDIGFVKDSTQFCIPNTSY